MLLEAVQGNLERALDLAVRVYDSNVGRWESDPEAELVARLHHALGHGEEAREWTRKIRGPRTQRVMSEFGPGRFARPLYRRAQFEVLEGSPDAAAHLERSLRFLTIAVRNSRSQPDGIDMVYRSLTLARMGRREEAMAEIQRALRAEPESAEAAYHAACVYSLLGDDDQALGWLGTAVDRGHQELWWARVDPDLDTLRDHPRFHEIMKDWDARLGALAGATGVESF